jgi:hypothetical protein
VQPVDPFLLRRRTPRSRPPNKRPHPLRRDLHRLSRSSSAVHGRLAAGLPADAFLRSLRYVNGEHPVCRPGVLGGNEAGQPRRLSLRDALRLRADEPAPGAASSCTKPARLGPRTPTSSRSPPASSPAVVDPRWGTRVAPAPARRCARPRSSRPRSAARASPGYFGDFARRELRPESSAPCPLEG